MNKRIEIKVLVVEDNPGDFYLISEILATSENHSFTVLHAERLVRGRELIATESPDVVLLDMGLPDSNGEGSIAEFISSNPLIPVIIQTGTADEKSAIRLVNAGAQDYLVKGMINSFILTRAVIYAIERKNNENKIKRLEQKYENLYNLGADALLLVDNETCSLLEANKMAEQLYGYTHDELLSLKNIDLSAEPGETKRLTESMPGNCEETIHIVLRWNKKKNGKVFPVEITGRVFEWEGRKVHLAAVRDISDKVKAEQALKESEEKWRTLFEILPVGVSILDKNGNISEFNSALERILEISKDDLKKGAHKYRKYYNSENIELTLDEIPSKIAIREQKIISNAEICVIKEDGGKIWTQVSAAPLNLPDATCAIVTTNITERKNYEHALLNSSAEWQMTFDSIPDPIAIFSDTCRMIRANKAMEEFSGIDFSEMSGKSCWGIVHDSNHSVFECPSQKMLASKKRETTCMRIKGKWTEVTADPILDKNGNVTGIVHIIKDITEKREKEQIEEANRENLDKIYNLTIGLMSLTPRENIFQYISSSLQLIGKSVIIVSSFNSDTRLFTCESISGDSESMHHLENILGRNPKGISMQINDETLKVLKKGKLEKASGGLRQISMNQIPEQVCYEIEKALGMKNAYGIGITRNKKLLGSVAILSMEDTLNMSHELVDIFISNVASTLQRKLAEQKLRESEERYRHLIKSLPNMLLIHREGRILYANDVLLTAFGKTVDDIKSENIFNYISPAYHQLVFDNIARGQHDESVENYEIELIINNESKYVIVSGENVRFEGMDASLVVLSDITERKKLETENQKNYDVQNIINSILKLSQEDIALNEILEKAFHMIIAIPWLSFDSKGCIFLYNEAGDMLQMVTDNNLPESVVENCGQIRSGQCLCGKVAQTRQILYDDFFEQVHEIRCEGIEPHGHYCVPITMGEKTLGVINIYLNENFISSPFEKNVLVSIANTLAGIIARKNSEASLHATMTNLELLVAKRTLEIEQRNTDLVTKIDEIQQGKKELQISEEKFRLTVEQAVDAIFMFDREGFFSGINSNACELTGYSESELLQMNLSQFFSREVLKEKPIRFDLLERGEIVINERLLMRKDGREVSIEMKTKKMPDASFQTFMRDISKRVEAEKNIIATLEKERELNLLKSRFISVVSHEFRTPLAGIQTSVELLERFSEKWDVEKKKEHYSRIYGNIRYTNLLLDDVSILGKQESGKLKLVIRPFSIVELFKLVISDVQAVFGTTVPIVADFDESLNIIELDESLMRHILSNIISNSVKYSKDESQVTVKVYLNNSSLHLDVSDHGIGIPEDDLKHIFEPFHRAVNVESIKGTGLGLTIVKNCIQLMGGEIFVKSGKDNGTTVFVTVPLGTK